ncbi:MAG TPA: hypothetical protein VGX68_12205 [Thermoanaerobaculia bacterium]|jgi:hypothetical protein|nr:hypothetical protein [Thermoanaerobaculia bacterium]
MRQLAALFVIITMLSGCATAGSRWEVAAVGAAVADLASTQSALGSSNGLQEGNPVMGRQPSAQKMLALNAGLYGGLWLFSRHMPPVQRQKIWRTVTIVRVLAAGWNLSQNGCACFKVSF